MSTGSIPCLIFCHALTPLDFFKVFFASYKDKYGLLERVLIALQEICVEAKAIDLTRLAVDGFFSSGKWGGEGVDYGYKGKGVTSHLIVDELGQPLAVTSTGASRNERKKVAPLLKKNQRLAKTSNF